MHEQQVVQCLTYLNQLDPRIQLNDAASDMWFYALEQLGMDEVIWVIRDYYATANPNGVGGVPSLTPATLKHRLRSAQERAGSKQRALEAPKRDEPMPSWRERNPEEFDRLYAKGRDDHRADLERRGIPLTEWQLAGDKRPTAFDHKP